MVYLTIVTDNSLSVNELLYFSPLFPDFPRSVKSAVNNQQSEQIKELLYVMYDIKYTCWFEQSGVRRNTDIYSLLEAHIFSFWILITDS